MWSGNRVGVRFLWFKANFVDPYWLLTVLLKSSVWKLYWLLLWSIEQFKQLKFGKVKANMDVVGGCVTNFFCFSKSSCVKNIWGERESLDSLYAFCSKIILLDLCASRELLRKIRTEIFN